MPVKLYGYLPSPSARSAMYTLDALSVPYELVELDLTKGEHLSEEYLRINPQHSVPTIEEEDGFILWDSHAINAYLVSKYGKDDKLYPKDPKVRAVVDQRLHFDSGVLFISLTTLTNKIFHDKTLKKMTDEYKIVVERAYGYLEKFLEKHQYAAGNDLTIADFSILSTLGTVSVLHPIDSEKFPLVAAFVKRGEANIPNYKETEKKGQQAMRKYLKNLNYEYIEPVA